MRAARAVPSRDKLRIPSVNLASQTVGDKLHGQEGNSPDHQLRSSSYSLVIKEVGMLRQPGGLPRSSHP